MYPVTFKEYLETQNPPLAEKLSQVDVLEEFSSNNLLLEAFNTYAFVGGMPEALTTFGETGSYSTVREIYDAIFMGYIEDAEEVFKLGQSEILNPYD